LSLNQNYHLIDQLQFKTNILSGKGMQLIKDGFA